ncbi:MAG: hypothetical protein KDC61_10785 [Saprospiraceae bacterium]|nr:hypothetical protein [Saprospiraceae bacterium]MCB0544405.1 hypothetical protein [Saprospiraceae bacterium]MCB0575035.1 hypothetical protein [Saprospiraceae bacterium]MCB9307119.1 hypothetical protein [Lewinellaceae bacterium]MCB9356709.1 hypothetical protein [Lewinellaceae bacterium]
MQPLDDQYRKRLDEIAKAIQAAPALEQYLEEEEDDFYNELRQEFEPPLSELHHQVAAEAPLQLVAFERALLEPAFEGLYLPRVLGYAVLRGEVNDQYRYVRPNDHFKEILLAICKSVHFDQLKKRIGQSISVGFALSSDIWITNLMTQVENKRIRYFLQQQNNDRFRDLKDRADLYTRYSNQFRHELYYSADFPKSLGEMKANFSALRQFLLKRFEVGGENESLKEQIKDFLENKKFQGAEEYLEMLAMYGNYIDLDPSERLAFATHFERERRALTKFDQKYLRFLVSLFKSPGIRSVNDERMSAALDKSYKDKISDYYRIADKIHSLGYVHPDAIDAVQEFYLAHQGLSVESECLRELVLQYFTQLVNGLTEREYADYFELTKIFAVYMKIFGNQQFNQDVEHLSMQYIGKLLKVFTDKRAKDYQDVKKFVSTQFVDLGFLKEKEVVEMFKTRRKKRKTAEE